MKRILLGLGVSAMVIGGCTVEQDVVQSGNYLCGEGDSCQWGWKCRRDPGRSQGHCVAPATNLDAGLAPARDDASDLPVRDAGPPAWMPDGAMRWDLGVLSWPDGGEPDGSACNTSDAEPCDRELFSLDVLCGTPAFGDRGLVHLGDPRVVATEEPELVTSCIYASTLPKNVYYFEDARQDRGVATTVLGGFPCAGGDGSLLAFMLGIPSHDSSAELEGKDLGQVLPGQSAAIYRRASRTEQVIDVYTADGATVLGRYVLSRWSWTPILARSSGWCPPLPTP